MDSTAAPHIDINPSVLYFGTPVVVISSLNDDNSTNLAPISSVWALGHLLVLGLGNDGHTLANLRKRAELVVNYCWDHQWHQVEMLALAAGADPVPVTKPKGAFTARDKFALAGWTQAATSPGMPLGIAGVGARVEAHVEAIEDLPEDGVAIVHARASRITADPAIVQPGTSHIDPRTWQPLIYNFRHYFALGERQGIAARAATQA